tara:strand:+ start:83 stop:295 length:213 start_codon:yes stop_codon:yes gene_type:complete
MINQEIIETQGRMFLVKRKLPESRINMDKFNKNGVSILKQYYHVDTILRAKNQLWFCNEIKTIEYEEIRN